MQDLLPVLREAFPTAKAYDTLVSVIQANAEGRRVVVECDNKNEDVFVKQVEAATYSSKKSWPDLRRTLMYLRTEVRFYNEIVPDLTKRGFNATPQIFKANYDLAGLIGEDEKATDQSKETPDPLNVDGKGGYIIMESIGEPYFQDSPITLDQAKKTCQRLLVCMLLRGKIAISYKKQNIGCLEEVTIWKHGTPKS